MKKFAQFSKKLSVVSLALLLAASAFSISANASDSSLTNSKNLKVSIKDVNAIKAVLSLKDSFKIPDKILDKNGKQAATGKYANTTPDGKVSWNVSSDTEMDSLPITKGISQNITLDGKKIAFPMTFANLGGEYSEFANFKFANVSRNNIPMVVENTKNKMKMMLLSGAGSFLGGFSAQGQSLIITDLFSKTGHKLGAVVNVQNNKIIGLISNAASVSNDRDVKINGIGVGNTFNEMYAKFGEPFMMVKNKMDNYSDTVVYYGYIDEKGNTYAAYFTHSDKKFDGKNYVKTKPNVITAVNIFYFAENE